MKFNNIALVLMVACLGGCREEKAQSKEAVYAEKMSLVNMRGKDGDAHDMLDFAHSPYQTSDEWANFGFVVAVNAHDEVDDILPVDGIRVDARVKNIAEAMDGNRNMFRADNPAFYISDTYGNGVDFLIGDKGLPTWKRWHCLRTQRGTAMFAIGLGQKEFLDGYPPPSAYDESRWIKRGDMFSYIITVEFRITNIGCDRTERKMLADFLFVKMPGSGFASTALASRAILYGPSPAPAPAPGPSYEGEFDITPCAQPTPLVPKGSLPGFNKMFEPDPNGLGVDDYSIKSADFMEYVYYPGWGWDFRPEQGNYPLVFSDSDPCLVTGWTPLDPCEWDVRCVDYVTKPDPNDPNTWTYHYPEPECYNPNEWFQKLIDWATIKTLIVEIESPAEIQPFGPIPAVLRVLSRPEGAIDYDTHDPNYYYMADSTPFWHRDACEECRKQWHEDCSWYIHNIQWQGDIHMADWTYDGRVNLEDFAELSCFWLDPNATDPLALWMSEATGDPNIDALELAVLIEHWGQDKWAEAWEPDLTDASFELTISLYPYMLREDGKAVLLHSDWYLPVNDARFAGWHSDSWGTEILLLPMRAGDIVDIRPVNEYDYLGVHQ